MAGARSDEAASEEVDSVQFSFYNEDEIRRISAKKITKSDLLDTKSCPVPDGLYDPAMGPLNDTDVCKSCGQFSVRCPGHFGHIEFAKPLFNPLLFMAVKELLQNTCFYCHRFKTARKKVDIFVKELDLLIKGDIVHAKNLEESGKNGFFSEEDDDITVAVSSDKLPPTEREDKTWTSIQFREALSTLSKLMKIKPKKCTNCSKKSPTITSPAFGWLIESTKVSDVKANLIADYKLNGDGDILESREPGGSGLDDELSSPGKSSKGLLNEKHISDDAIKTIVESSEKKHLLPTKVESILKDLWINEARFCMLLCDFQQKTLSLSEKRKGYEMFFLKSLLVTPNKFRPATGGSSRGIMEHPQNVLLSKVQEANLALQRISNDPNHMDILRKWMDLQRSVNILFDSSKGLVKSEKDANGIRQLLEKKSGILRQKMMGKRVNFACRSVISPDPYLAVNEIGIPPVFALRLTYPERVTPWNAKKLRNAIQNGADIHPGATHYKDHNSMYKLQTDPRNRRAIAKRLLASRGSLSQSGKDPECEFESKVVYRHLQDGDIVLVNRQPTLHKPSMMAHVVRVLHGEKTIRMHYANCNTYNADFDGDEMNVHFPQDEISRAEAISIVNANKQYIGPRSGDAVRGLIQDHIVSAVLLTKLDTFLSCEEYNQLVYGSCVPPSSCSSHQPNKMVSVINDGDAIELFPPAIWMPKPLWTGKQVITTILNHLTKGHPPFTVEQKGKVTKEYLMNKECRRDAKDTPQDPSEQVLCIHDNELIKGMIDKAQFGKYGIVHTVHELYGADTAGVLLSTLSRLFTMFLQLHGFTCGVDDLLLHQESDKQRREILETSEKCSTEVHRKFTHTEDDHEDPVKLQMEVEKVIRRNGESATVILDRMMSSALNVITSKVNQTLFPYGLQKSFPGNSLSLMTATGAKGGLVNMTQIASLLGQQELEGKRVPRMVSGKTLPCFPPWDTSSRAGGFISDRFLTGLRPQEYFFHCMAGREGLVDTAVKTSRSGYLQRCLIKSLESLKVSYDHTVRDVDGTIVQFSYGEDGVDVLKTSFLDKFRELADNRNAVLDRLGSYDDDQLSSKPNGFITKLPEKLIDRAMEFLKLPKEVKRCRYDIKKKELMKLLKVKYLASLVDPGEAVGVIAAQSIGEPSTQMTLNTFHLAGRGEMNVTLGIPRLQEILMAASEAIRTPFMKCPLLKDRTRDDAERLAAKLRRICLADVVESIEVCTVPFYIKNGHVSTLYKLQVKLYPYERYPPQSELTVEECQATLKNVFVNQMADAIEKHLKLLENINGIQAAKGDHSVSLASNQVEEESEIKPADGEDTGVSDGDDENENDDDLGADAERRKQQETDEMEYDDDIEKDEAMVGEDGEHKPELGGEDDLAESEDYKGEDSEEDEEAPDMKKSENISVHDASDAGKKGAILKGKKNTAILKGTANKNKEDEKSVDMKQTEKPRKRREKFKPTVHFGSKDLTFEVCYALDGKPHILLAQIAQKTAKSICVKSCENIERSMVVEPEKKDSPLLLQTAGVNFEVFWDLSDYLNIKEVRSNDIHAMLRTYGVEAARATIIQEVSGVFGAYGIDVNMRHLSLIADFMTCNGGYRPMSRLGMGQSSTSPFGKMTFETATKFIVEAAYHGEVDTLECPSASVCLGKPVKMGTGSFGLLLKIDLAQPTTI